MLEKQMEEAVANCPDLFIEPGLTLIRRQVVINGRLPAFAPFARRDPSADGLMKTTYRGISITTLTREQNIPRRT